MKPASVSIALLSVLAATSIPMGYPEAYLLNKFFVSHLILGLAAMAYFAVNGKVALTLRSSKDRGFFWVWAAFLLWMGLASALSPLATGKMLSYGMWLKTALIPSALALIAWVEIKKDGPTFLASFEKGVLLSGMVFFAFGLLEFLAPDFARARILSEFRWAESLDQNYSLYAGLAYMPVAGLFAHYNLFGVSQALCAVLSLPKAWDLLRKRPRIATLRESPWLFLLSVFFVAGVVLSTSKTAILALAAGLCAHFWMRSKKRAFLRTAGIFLALCVVGVGVAALNPQTRVRLTPLVDSVLSGRNPGAHVMNGRDLIYSTALSIIQKHPVKGIGAFQTDNYVKTHGIHQKAIHNHNLILEYGVTGGLVALLLFGALVYFAFIRGPRGNSEAFASLFVAFLISQMTDTFVAHELWYGCALYVLLASGHAWRARAG